MGDDARRCSGIPLLACVLTVLAPVPYAAAAAPAPAPSAAVSPRPVPGATLSHWFADRLGQRPAGGAGLPGLAALPGLSGNPHWPDRSQPKAPGGVPPGGSPGVSAPAPSATSAGRGHTAAAGTEGERGRPGHLERDEPVRQSPYEEEAASDVGAALPPEDPERQVPKRFERPDPGSGEGARAAEPAPWSPAPVASEGRALADAEPMVVDQDTEPVGAGSTGPVLPVLPLGAGLMSIGLGMAFLALRLRRG